MDKLVFYIVDVFAEQRYAGNQLAVFRRGGGLSGEEMQQIAREMNFSETTFILSEERRDGGFDVRIFTPGEEVPFAGHPTLGTAFVIRNEILQGKAEKVVLNLKVGQIPVTFGEDGYCWMKQIEPTFGPRYEAETLAGILGLEVAELDGRYPIEEVSTGLPFFIVPLKTIASLKKAAADRGRYFELIKNTAAKGIMVFCPESHEAQNDISVRMFGDYYGVAEDAATGSGNGCLAGYLVKHRYFGQGAINLRAEQGYEIGRPSLLRLRAEDKDAHIDVYVGGKSILIARGEWA